MQILPLKFVREEDKKIIGVNLYNLARLNHLGLPVIESAIAIAPVEIFKKVINKHVRDLDDNARAHFIKNEILKLPIPESLENLDLFKSQKKSVLTINILKLWENLLEKWSMEMVSKIERKEKNILDLTPQLVVFSANFSSYGTGFFDEDRSHVSIKTNLGKLDFKISQEIEDLILFANRKILLPQVYYWAVEDSKVKIIKVLPFTQSLSHEVNEKAEETATVARMEIKRVKTATKIWLEYQGEILDQINTDGVLLKIKKPDIDSVNIEIEKILKIEKEPRIIFYPEFESDQRKNLEYAKIFLFFRNKRNIDAQIVLPKINSKDEFLNYKRELASLGIYSKGSLKIWKQFSTFGDFINFSEYLDTGFDGALIDLNSLCEFITGTKPEVLITEPKLEWISAIEGFLKQAGLSKIIKEGKPVLIMGHVVKSEELLNYLIRTGVWGLTFESQLANGISEHIAFIEKQVVKRLTKRD